MRGDEERLFGADNPGNAGCLHLLRALTREGNAGPVVSFETHATRSAVIGCPHINPFPVSQRLIEDQACHAAVKPTDSQEQPGAAIYAGFQALSGIIAMGGNCLNTDAGERRPNMRLKLYLLSPGQ